MLDNKKMDSTPHCSRVVPHPSTKRAQTALTSVFGWEPVHYGWYGRIHYMPDSNYSLSGMTPLIPNRKQFQPIVSKGSNPLHFTICCLHRREYKWTSYIIFCVVWRHSYRTKKKFQPIALQKSDPLHFTIWEFWKSKSIAACTAGNIGEHLRPWTSPRIVVVGRNEDCWLENKSPEQRLNLSRSWHKATLVRTIPSSLFKSYTKDLLLPIFELVFQHRLNLFSQRHSAVTKLWSWPRGYAYSCNIREQKHIAAYQHGFWLRGVQP